MSDCIGTGCKAEAMQRQIAKLRSENTKLHGMFEGEAQAAGRLQRERDDALYLRLEMQKERDDATQDLKVAEAKIALMERDMANAAGALMVDIPEPGTDMAKVMRANSKMRRERNIAVKALQDVCALYISEPREWAAMRMHQRASSVIRAKGGRDDRLPLPRR